MRRKLVSDGNLSGVCSETENFDENTEFSAKISENMIFSAEHATNTGMFFQFSESRTHSEQVPVVDGCSVYARRQQNLLCPRWECLGMSRGSSDRQCNPRARIGITWEWHGKLPGIGNVQTNLRHRRVIAASHALALLVV